MNRASLYRQVMGDAFATLDPAVQRFHSAAGKLRFEGEVAVDGAESPLGRCIAWLGRLPAKAERAPFSFLLDANREREIWIRNFSGRTMRSILSADGKYLVERLGFFKLKFSLAVRDGRLQMQLLRITAFGIACPRALFPDVFAEERGTEGRFHFDIQMSMPLAGRVVRYRGYLGLNGNGSAT